MASHFYPGHISWAGVVLIMTDGSKRAIEFNHPYRAELRVTGGMYGTQYGNEVTLEISGNGTRWHYGEEATPPQPAAGAIEAGPREIERGHR